MVYFHEALLHEAELKAQQRAREEEERKKAAALYRPTPTNLQSLAPQPAPTSPPPPAVASAPAWALPPAPRPPVTTEMPPPEMQAPPNAFAPPVQNTVSADVRRLLDQGSGDAIQARQEAQNPLYGTSLPNIHEQRGQTSGDPFWDTVNWVGGGAANAFAPLDKAVFQPLDVVSETSADLLERVINPNQLGQDFRNVSGRVSNAFMQPQTPVSEPESISSRLARNFEIDAPALYGDQLSSFREGRSPGEQILLGSAFDLTSALPGVGLLGIGADAGRATRVGGEILQQSPVEQFRRTLGLTDEAAQTVGGGSAHTAPGPRAPGGVESIAPTEVRRGNLLNAEDLRQSKPDYTVQDAIKVAESLERQVEAIPNVIRSRVKVGIRQLGKLDKTHTHIQTADRQWVSIYDAAQNPSAYALTNEQRQGLQDLGGIITDVRADREVFGIDPALVDVADDGAFIPRSVKSTPEGEIVSRGTGGSKLSASKREGSRVYETAAEAEQNGVVYKSIEESIDDYVRRWERAAANTHIKDMLVPFSETSAMRVPPALREQMDTLRGFVTQLKDSVGRLDEKARHALDAFLESDIPDVDALRDTLDSIVISRGRFKGEDVQNLRRILDETKQQIRTMAPEWRKALNNAKSPRPGRVMADTALTPALTARDFAKDDWNRIARHYTRTTPRKPWAQQHLAEKGVTVLREGLNIPLRFFQATMDASAILRQQGSALARHPAVTARNIIRSIRDVFDSTAYDEFIGSEIGQKWARRGAAVFGDSGDVAEFQASGWMARIPGIKQANNHFVRYNTQNRLEHMELAEQWLANKVKRPITEAEGEQIANQLNRATGVSASRGSSLESDLMFASRYTRATIEDVVKAVADRGIEGQLARQYLGSLMALTATLSVTSALVNGIPLDEVLNPLDRRALRRGEIRMNPNFLSVRVAGHDMKPLGSYDSLARLAFVAADSASGAIQERDAYRLFDAIGQTTGTKGSPVVSFITDLIKGETFEGEDPLSPESLAKRPLPFSADRYVEAVRNPSVESIVGGGFEALGEKVSPLSFADKQDQIALDLFGKRYIDLEPAQVTAVRDDPRYPEFEQEEGSAGARLDDLKDQVTVDMKGLEADLNSNLIQPGEYGSRRSDILAPYRTLVKEHAETFDDPIVQSAMNVFGDIIEKHTTKVYGEGGFTEETDWDAVSADVAKEDQAVQDIIAERSGIGLTPTDQEYIDTFDFLANKEFPTPFGGKASYFGLADEVFDIVVVQGGLGDAIGVSPRGKEPDEYWDEVYTTIANRQGDSAQAVAILNQYKGRYDQRLTEVRRAYRAQHPEVLEKAQRFGIAGLGLEEAFR